MYRLPRAVLTQILAVRRKKEQGLPVDECATGSTCHPTAGDCSGPGPVFHEGNVGECLL